MDDHKEDQLTPVFRCCTHMFSFFWLLIWDFLLHYNLIPPQKSKSIPGSFRQGAEWMMFGVPKNTIC